ncbi:4Fe-4S dicluster domain-containing protein [Acidaminobacter hydrogenoformans]|uniref:4Fe-4S dicluster domain-containing protein n=1 Tax=Acidaminobacter hydrogenoformans DSM 2784 TaxID=1120920 RepID=A0A1G5RVC2_9FIRM|nr:4Fe-4S dicluster domain-containing protein [Acidaminobacter hydrogenoformans]SCZ78095.1 4Fe-4S dicluster domain-containing protein [Acidaminobacter hydrogenoformans DSM 2784]
MGHLTAKNGYENLVARLNKFPQGAPPSETLYKILGILLDEREAELISKLPIRAFTADTAAKRWAMSAHEAAEILDSLARRALLVDILKGETTYYILPPPMAGFIEFSMMRIREDIDQHSLGQLLYQYMNIEEDFIRALFFDTDTKIVRAFVNEPALSQPEMLEIMDYERATEVIKGAAHIGVGVCYCRHKMAHVGKQCDAPMEICMTFGNVADSLIRSGYAKRITSEECLVLLNQAYAHNLVQVGENVQNEVAFICNCCGCCCEALLAAKKFGTTLTIATTNYLPQISHENCTRCGKCVRVCPVDALDWDREKSPERLRLKEEMCLGCGVCVRNCHFGALELIRRERRVMTPVNTVHHVVLAAIDKGMLPNLIFDNDALASHRVLASILSAILTMPPAKQLLANEQIRSKYLAKLIK